MGFVPSPPPVQLNVDRWGLPKDYATYEWLMYGRRVQDDSPERRLFLFGPSDGARLPPADPRLIDTVVR